MITTYNTAVSDAASEILLGRNVSGKSHGSPKMFSTSVMKGEIWRRNSMKQKEKRIQESKQEDSEGSEESKGGLDRCSVR